MKDVQKILKGQPNGRIQWKGADISIDINCECGKQFRYNGNFMYGIQCPHCKRIYHNPHIQLIEVDRY